MVGTLTYRQVSGNEKLPGCEKQFYVEYEICKLLSTIKSQVSNQNMAILVLLVNKTVLLNRAFYIYRNVHFDIVCKQHPLNWMCLILQLYGT